LTTQLPPRPGESWVVVGTDILLVSVSTNVILDVLHDLF
jgi:Ni/Co efflux regulator RcnB